MSVAGKQEIIDKIWEAFYKKLRVEYGDDELFMLKVNYDFKEHLLQIDIQPLVREDRTREETEAKMHEIILKSIKDYFDYYVQEYEIDNKDEFDTHITFGFKLSPVQERDLIDYGYDNCFSKR